jgi:ABC-type spermidine/putrescine transport system permease subunit II
LTALVLERYAVRGRNVLRLMILAPLIVPYIVQAVGLFRVFLALGMRGSVVSIMVAHTVIAIPYVVLVVSAGLKAVPRSLEEAARVLGANGFIAVWRITLPLIQASIAASAVFAFINSWDEFIMAFFLAGASTETLPIRMFMALRDFVDPRLTAISTLLVLINLAAVLLFTWFLRRSRQAVGMA